MEPEATRSTRERILDAAAAIIVDQGVGGLRVRELAQAVGIREGSLYNHFSGREAIIQALFVDLGKGMSPLGGILDLDTISQAQLEQTGKFIREQGLAGFFVESGKHLVRHFHDQPGALRLLQAVLSARFHDASARRAYEEIFLADIARVIGAVCHFAAEGGKLDAAIDVPSLASLFAAAFEHAIGLSFGKDGLEQFETSLTGLMASLGGMIGWKK
jgi:AcrR family transcriptional regulator